MARVKPFHPDLRTFLRLPGLKGGALLDRSSKNAVLSKEKDKGLRRLCKPAQPFAVFAKSEKRSETEEKLNPAERLSRVPAT